MIAERRARGSRRRGFLVGHDELVGLEPQRKHADDRVRDGAHDPGAGLLVRPDAMHVLELSDLEAVPRKDRVQRVWPERLWFFVVELMPQIGLMMLNASQLSTLPAFGSKATTLCRTSRASSTGNRSSTGK